MCNHEHNPMYCAIPPYMVDNILKNGTKKQVEKVKNSIAQAGKIRGQRQALAKIAVKPKVAIGQKDRLIYNANHGSFLLGTLSRSEGDSPTGEQSVDEAYDGAGATYDLYSDIFNRNSIDDNGMQLISTVHFLQGYDNAFWNGQQMVYGDGDEDLPEADRLFNRFTIAIDVIGHELTHGVTQFEANLVYQDQPGALNESFSDIFGSLVKQRVNNQTAQQADWIIGEGLFTSNIKGSGIRSMKNPGTAYNDPVLGKDPQPGHMNDYVITTRDNGGVHINSGIPNKAFYLAAIAIGGYAWEKAGKIWYSTLKDKLESNSDFQKAANLTCDTASELYGKNSMEHKAVRKAWEDVGVLIHPEENGGCLELIKRMFGLSN